MAWWEILIAVAVTFVLAAMITYIARMSLVQAIGKKTFEVQLGRGMTEETYMLDEEARKRVKVGTIISFVIILACTGACVWNFISTVIMSMR
jgi:hypothetical protein